VQLARLDVEVGDLGHQDTDILMALEDRPQRIGDLAGRQGAGRDLVGERLEEVKIPPVDERHLNGSSPELQDGLESAEAAADDDHSVYAVSVQQ
jgi:hypothetical protein